MAVDSGLIVAVAFVDFRKAFDSFSRRVLLEKLRANFGICDQAQDWIASYLNGRKYGPPSPPKIQTIQTV